MGRRGQALQSCSPQSSRQAPMPTSKEATSKIQEQTKGGCYSAGSNPSANCSRPPYTSRSGSTRGCGWPSSCVEQQPQCTTDWTTLIMPRSACQTRYSWLAVGLNSACSCKCRRIICESRTMDNTCPCCTGSSATQSAYRIKASFQSPIRECSHAQAMLGVCSLGFHALLMHALLFKVS